ncbi:MAG: extracellular solute-binding protein [Caldilineaceae bacterium]|nr:extracellular solute-binding protein [Caldilineaceae bacterium]
MQKTVALLLVLLICIACTSQSSAWTGVNDTNITVYTPIPRDLVSGYLAAFEAEHPEIEVTLVNEATLALVEQLLAEEDAPRADVIWGLAVTSMLTLEWNSLLTMYTPAGIERVEPIFLDGRQPPQWVGIAARAIVLCVNQAKLDEQNLATPTSWQDLIDPMYQGHLLILSPGQTNVGNLLISTILQLYGDTAGWEYLAQLDENVEGVYASDERGVCEAVLRGDYAIGLTYDYRAYFPGEPTMKVVIPQEGAGWDMEVNALVRKERIKNAAKVFLDWAISDSAMKLYTQERMITAAATDVETMVDMNVHEDASYLFDLDIAWIAANRERIQKRWMSLYGADSRLVDTS